MGRINGGSYVFASICLSDNLSHCYYLIVGFDAAALEVCSFPPWKLCARLRHSLIITTSLVHVLSAYMTPIDLAQYLKGTRGKSFRTDSTINGIS